LAGIQGLSSARDRKSRRGEHKGIRQGCASLLQRLLTLLIYVGDYAEVNWSELREALERIEAENLFESFAIAAKALQATV